MDNKKADAATLKEIIEGTADQIMNTIGVADNTLRDELCIVLHKIAMAKIIEERAVNQKEVSK